METRRYIFAVVASFPIAAAVFLTERLGVAPNGSIVGGVEIFIELVCALSLAFHPKSRQLLWRVRFFLILFFLSLFVADAFYIEHFFVNSRLDSDFYVAMTTKVPYSVAFLSAIAAMALAAESLSFFSSWTFPVSATVVLPVAFKFIIFPYVLDADQSPLALVRASEAMDIFLLVLLLIFALATYLSARSLTWSFFAAALATLVLGDWAIRVETILAGQTSYGIYEFLWAYGVYLCALPFLFGREIQSRIETFSSSSLLNSFKVTTLLVSFVPLFFICLTQRESLTTVKIISIGVPLVLIFSVLWSHQYLSRLSQMSYAVGQLFSRKLSPALYDAFPLELRPVLVQVEEQVAAAEQVEMELHRAKAHSDVVAKIAHDIRSPLSAISCTLSSCSGIREDAMRLMKSAINRVQEIAAQTLNGDLSPPRKPLVLVSSSSREQPLHLHVEKIIAEKRALWVSAMVSVEMHCSHDFTQANCRLDGVAFERALSNLLDNAKDAIGDSGSISVRCRIVDDHLAIEIRDSGKGIPAEILSRIGEAGFSWGKPQGNGLGFSYSRSTIESFGGQLTLESIEGKGTLVRIEVPQA